MTAVLTPDAELFRAYIHPLGWVEINDSRQGYVAWAVDCLNGSFMSGGMNATISELRFGSKSKSVTFGPDWNNKSNTYKVLFEQPADDMMVAVTVDQGQPTEATYFLRTGMNALEIRGE
jgi:hypothetical protein